MAEVHFIGSLLGASKFPNSSLTCKYKVVTSSPEDWKLLEGKEYGQTHIDTPFAGNTVWYQPLDLHYSTKSLKGWPYLYCEVYHLDQYGRHELYGYAFTNLPTSPGTHRLEFMAWRPVGSLYDRLLAFFLGVHPQLKNPELAYKSSNRFKLNTETMGILHAEITVLLRGFDSSNLSV
ncbi:hypothetical protein MP638_002057 [Amoeboaphelidium occidentale]|nr:hypothetical protein MP638_002057 [Amoeboaphelidium occidentale]